MAKKPKAAKAKKAGPASDQPRRARFKTWQDGFLFNLRKTCSVTQAALAMRIDRSTAYREREINPVFRAAWDETVNQQDELLEASAMRRATFGTTRPHYHQGTRCGEEQVYPDSLTQFLLERRMPDKYGRFGAGDEDPIKTAERFAAFAAAARATQQGPPEFEQMRAKLAAMQAELDALKAAAEAAAQVPADAPPSSPPPPAAPES